MFIRISILRVAVSMSINSIQQEIEHFQLFLWTKILYRVPGSNLPGFDHQLDLFRSSPEFKSSTTLVNSQLVCLRPVRILNNVMLNLNYLFELFARPHQPFCYKHCRCKLEFSPVLFSGFTLQSSVQTCAVQWKALQCNGRHVQGASIVSGKFVFSLPKSTQVQRVS